MEKLFTTEKTKKVRTKPSQSKIASMWTLFDDEINPSSSKTLECMLDPNENIDFCEMCSSTLYTTDEGFYSCTNQKCGIIYKNMVDQTAEWRYYGADHNHSDDPTRCGMPINPLLKESSYGCKVICQGASSYEMRKIRRYTEWQSMPYREKSQYDDFQFITTMAQNAGISKFIIDDAMKYHKKISEHKTFRGLNRDGILAASIYISCRINNNPRTAKEIASIFCLNTRSSTKGCKNAMSIINNLEHEMDNNEKTVLCNTRPESFIERYCSRLNINQELTKLAQFIALRIEKNKIIPENTPHSIAAGIIYFIGQMCHLNITKRDVHYISEISEVTINKCYKKLEKLRDELIPAVVLQKYAI